MSLIKEKEDSLEVKPLQIHYANHEEFRGSVENVLEAMGSAHLLHEACNVKLTGGHLPEKAKAATEALKRKMMETKVKKLFQTPKYMTPISEGEEEDEKHVKTEHVKTEGTRESGGRGSSGRGWEEGMDSVEGGHA